MEGEYSAIKLPPQGRTLPPEWQSGILPSNLHRKNVIKIALLHKQSQFYHIFLKQKIIKECNNNYTFIRKIINLYKENYKGLNHLAQPVILNPILYKAIQLPIIL